MSQTIHRMYESHERALQAAEALRTNRFIKYEHVFVFTRYDKPDSATGATASTVDETVAWMMKEAYILKAHARVFAEAVHRGGSLLTVHAPFGTAAEAMDILDRHDPIDSGVPEPHETLPIWDVATPCSNVLGWRVLLDDSATFAKFWNLPPLSKGGQTTSAALGLPEVSKANGVYTGLLGLPLISRDSTTLSAKLGLPVLLNESRAGR